jgi:hypothetical protein
LSRRRKRVTIFVQKKEDSYNNFLENGGAVKYLPRIWKIGTIFLQIMEERYNNSPEHGR